MTKQEIKAHKEVIKWFIDNPDKGVWGTENVTPRVWELIDEPQFYIDNIYIQNDKYLEFRGALAEGKIVELDNTYLYDTAKEEGWIAVDKILDYIPLAHYRIKPEEPKFKVGDWAVHPCMPHPWQVTKNSLDNLNDTLLKLWKPKKGEFCVFWDTNEQEYFVTQFREKQDEGYFTISGYWFKHVAPLEFIQTLKDK